ncbi:hypothetical protein [Mucilaginibacter paludis]|uniref:YXWGXW repeat-containing protein n=1 Tax=Mucilaginibacter paludis DSM 18603 TaxID=714943 RepID=H1YDK1_9SPHI|nr:hypothetical protein [Mucilaginibacter paludis]EHQ30210.1 hypothetical protein Mucpa_6152 [Mucilaginibacter paludis DSM 18603]
MKKLILVSAIAISGLMYQTASAQIGLHLNVNLGPRPVYVAPAPVYNDADYYYLPEVEAYYSVSNHCYYYQDGGNWITGAYLPGRFHDYDWQHARRFAVNEPRPYLHNDVYRARYGGIQGRRDWGRRDDHNVREYASQDRFNHDENRRNDNQHYDARPNQQRNDQGGRGNYNDRGDHDNGDHGRRGRF